MQRITSSKLAELLQNGFGEKILFSGSVSCRLKEEPQFTFYKSSGEFSLTRAGRKNGTEEGSYLLTNNESMFYFKPKVNKQIVSTSHERYGNVIAFPIDFPAKAVLQIEPREITF